MKEPPDWGRYTDRELQEAIATNVFTTARDITRIYHLLCWAIGAGGGVYLGNLVRQEGWRALFGGWF